jgi:hypothetical protein
MESGAFCLLCEEEHLSATDVALCKMIRLTSELLDNPKDANKQNP